MWNICIAYSQWNLSWRLLLLLYTLVACGGFVDLGIFQAVLGYDTGAPLSACQDMLIPGVNGHGTESTDFTQVSITLNLPADPTIPEYRGKLR